MKKKKLILVLTLMVWAGMVSTSCGGDDSPPETTVEPDPDPDPDPDPTGFLGELDFVKTFGGSDIDEANDVVLADDGSYVILGTTKSTNGDITDKTGPDADFWALKVSTAGDIVWSKTYGGSNDDEGYALNKTDDGGYILIGYSRSSDGDVGGNEGFQDIWIVKIDGSGNIQWETHHGFLGGEQGLSIVQTNDGGYFAVGYLDLVGSGGQGDDLQDTSGSSRNNRHGLGEYWGIKLDANGNKEWRRYFGGTNNDRSFDVLQTSDNGYL
ncbi:MAG: hypothetical protein KTR22_07385, partial [Flavobacteriaceae bacterium]|nr:hypothetical protein [Flavobacteriaceae bacterium]